MKRILNGIGRVFGSAGRATIALLGICGIVAALANNYALTQGTGTTFGSLLISGVNYAQQMLCDATTPTQCAAVSSGGAVKVDASATIQPVSATVLPLPTGAGTAANQSTIITNTGNTATSTATTATNTGTTATNTGTTATNVGTTNTNMGAPGATACTTDTASCSLNQLLQRVAQRISSLIALLPTSLGTGGGLKVDGSGTALPVSAAALPLPTNAAQETGGSLATLAGAVSSAKVQENVSQINGVAPLMGNGQTGTGAQRVTLSQDSLSVPINISTSTTTQLVALSGSTSIYVTSEDVIAGGTGTFQFVYGTGTACATGQQPLTGAYPLTAQAGLAKGDGAGTILKVPSGNALCAITVGAVQYSGAVSYLQF